MYYALYLVSTFQSLQVFCYAVEMIAFVEMIALISLETDILQRKDARIP